MALGHNPKILQIVGYQNSGKTTVTQQMIRYLTAQGLKVGTIKHHAHGKPAAPPQKDSTLHEEAGAVIAAVEGNGTLRLAIEQPLWTLTQILQVYEPFELDAIIVEGYKKELHRKVVLLRHIEDFELLQLPNIVAIIYWPDCPTNKIPPNCFSINDSAQYLPFLAQEMRGK